MNKRIYLVKSHPELVLEWHPTKNILTLERITYGSNKYAWWLCEKGHEYETKIYHRTISGSRCPYCYGKKLSKERSLACKRPDLSKEFHPTKNGALDPTKIHASARQIVWWICSIDSAHEWQSTVDNRNKGNGCPYCTNRGGKVSNGKSLGDLYENLNSEWDYAKNTTSPYDFTPFSNKKAWWACAKNKEHRWKTAISHRVGGTNCPFCSSGWTIENIRLFVAAILPYIETFTEAELYVLFQQNGLLEIGSSNKGRSFVQALKTGRFPKEELEKFVNHEDSLVNKFINDPMVTLESEDGYLLNAAYVLSENDIDVRCNELRIIETKDVLATLNGKIYANLDSEAVDFFIKSANAKIWQHAFIDEAEAIRQLAQHYNSDNLYAQEVTKLFKNSYKVTKNLIIPSGYGFTYAPDLMQRYTAYLVKTRKRIGNWSETGTGKTIAAILASRVIDAKLTVICCPNNVIDTWIKNIKMAYPDSVIFVKDTKIKDSAVNSDNKYLILNYEFFQQATSKQKLEDFLEKNKIDFVIIDEIHYAKQREERSQSWRKQRIAAFLSEAVIKNMDICVLGMSATPVLNNLYEGKTLIELVTGVQYNDLDTRATPSNCISLYQKFITHGIRMVPNYSYKLNERLEPIDCSKEIKQSSLHSIVDHEEFFTKLKIPFILKNLQPKTIVYTHYIQNILHILQTAIEKYGWRVAIFTGDIKDDLDKFIKGDADILIASSCIGTGVDGLQDVCNRLIINSLPWTSAEYKQLIGRIYRQGQKKDTVDVIIPLPYVVDNNTKRSWCESRWKRILFKKSIADAAIDGGISEGHLRTKEQALQDYKKWIERLQRGEIHEVERQQISTTFSSDLQKNAIRKIGDIIRMNQQINKETSQDTNKRFMNNPQAWYEYHEKYGEARKEWEVIPYKEAIKWCKARPHLVIGDFGCGKAFLAQELTNQVHSFDHIAINENVIACDMKQVPLGDLSLDAAIFSLSLMGTNFVDYLKEAKRCLKLDGHLWICEPTARIKDINLFKEILDRLGFDVGRIDERGKFTFIKASKSEREINQVVLKSVDCMNILD
ncbi:MAG: zinc-ribbon domain-containing protein [Candidatus Babeliaceae bacterium]|jgi:superfamily II DNA or RNA helicase